MERKVPQINISKAVASPVLTGRDDNYMWTGLVRSDKITKHMIHDDEQREKFISKVRDVELSVLKYRSSFRASNSVLQVKPGELDTETENHILKVCREIKTILNNPGSIGIDMDLFWVELCREYEEIKEKNPHEFLAMNKDVRKNLEAFREFLNKNNPPIREIYDPEDNKYRCLQFLTRGQEIKKSKNNKSNTENLLDILDSIAEKEDLSAKEGIEIVRELCGALTLADLPIVFSNEKYADMQYISTFKNYLLGKDFTYEDIEKMSLDEIIEESGSIYSQGNFDLHSHLMANTIISGIDYLDIEKLMLLVAVRYLEAYELMSPKVQENDDKDAEMIKELSQREEEGLDRLETHYVEETGVAEIIERTRRSEYVIRKILDSGIIDKKTRFKIISGKKEIECSQKRIEELMQNFCDGVYLSETMQLTMVYGACNNQNSMEELWTDELVKRIYLSESDIYALSAINFKNLKRLYSLGRMDKNQIRNLIAEAHSGILYEKLESTYGTMSEPKMILIKQNSADLLKNLYNSQIIDEKDIAEYFDSNIITLENLDSLEEGKSSEEIERMHNALKEEFNQDRLLIRYKKYVSKYNEFIKFQSNNPDDYEEIERLREEMNVLKAEKERYRLAFNKYNKILETEKINFGDDLFANYYVNFEVTDELDIQESIKTLYEDGFIDLENIIHFDKKYIIPMLDRLSIKDAYRVRNSMTFEELEDMLDNIFDDPKFSDERKFIIVMNLLGEDTDQDKEAREFYLEMLDFNDDEKKIKSKGTRKIKNHGVGGNTSNKYVYPDIIKWKFYKALDPECRVTRYSNGFVEFASSKLGVRIIEKYYDGNKPAYGTATYILPEDVYRKNEPNLVTIHKNGNILESAVLRDITPQKDRIAHRTQSADKTWMDQMINYFNIDFEAEKETRYTPEGLMDLDSVRKKYKLDYEIID